MKKYTKSYFWILILLVVLTVQVYGQEIEPNKGSLQVGLVSPTSAKLGTYGNIPVGLYTGTPEIKIPLYTINEGEIKLPISISYNASGIKVAERGDWMGVGWSLNAGMITRTMRGLPDENGNGYIEAVSKYDFSPVNQSLLKKAADGVIDTEPDVFFYNFGDKSGKMIFDSTASLNTIPDSPLRFEINDGNFVSGSNITFWRVWDENGFVYEFKAREFTQIENQPSYESGWYLTSIKDPTGNAEVKFEYSSYTVNEELPLYEKKIPIRINETGEPISASYKDNIYKISSQKIDGLYLDKIVSRTDTIRFNRSSSGLLNQIIVEKKGHKAKEYQLSFSPYSSNEYRYKLDSLTKYGEGQLEGESYLFEYNTDVVLPPRNSKSVDHWGYYNGKNNSSFLPQQFVKAPTGQYITLEGADRSVSFEHSKAGILTSIQYPTGGMTEFTYEPNDYGKIGTENIVAGEDTTLKLNANSIMQPVETKETIEFEIEFKQKVVVDYSMNCNHSYDPCGNSVNIIWTDKSQTVFAQVLPGNSGGKAEQKELLLEPGIYLATVSYSSGDKYNPASTSMHIRYEKPLHDNLFQAEYGSGLRIKKMVSYDGNGNSSIKRYKYMSKEDPNRSSGSLVSFPQYADWYTVNTSMGDIHYVVHSSKPLYSLGSTQGSPIGYSHVSEFFSEDSSQGWMSHSFTSPATHPDIKGVPNGPGTSSEWKRGKLTDQEVYHGKTGDRLQKVKRDYKVAHVDKGSSMPALYAARMFSGHLSVNGYTFNFDYISSSKYFYNSFFIHPELNTMIRYSPQGEKKLFKSKKIYYEDPSHLQPTGMVETNTDGQQRVTTYEYAHEDEYPGMESEHMLSQPYKVTTKDGSGNILNINWTLWDKFDTNDDGIPDYWKPCAQWTGGPELGTADPPDC